MPEPALRLVDADGVIVGEQDAPHRHGCPHCQEMQDEVDGLNRELKAWRLRYASLERDQEREARKDKLWPTAEKLFGEWRRACNKPRSQFTYDRFRECKPFVKRHGYDLCLVAIEGAGFDSFEKPQKNGRVKRFNDWKLIFRDEDTFESFANRAPAEAVAAYKAKTAPQEEPDDQ